MDPRFKPSPSSQYPEPRKVKVMEPEAPVTVPEPIQGPQTDADWLRNIGVKP